MTDLKIPLTKIENVFFILKLNPMHIFLQLLELLKTKLKERNLESSRARAGSCYQVKEHVSQVRPALVAFRPVLIQFSQHVVHDPLVDVVVLPTNNTYCITCLREQLDKENGRCKDSGEKENERKSLN